ncbi:hypothetical protein Tco_0844686 [Tanacetum coccineum]
MESLNSNSQEREMHQLQQMQDKAKEKCMESFRLLHSHLKQLDREEFQETESIGAFRVLMKQFQTFVNFLYCFDDFDSAMIRKSFLEHTRTEIQQFRDTLIQHMKSVKKSIDKRAQHKREKNRRVNDRVMQSKEGKVDSSTALDVGLVVMESNETESERHVSSSRSGKDTHAEDADINFVNDKQPLGEVQLTVQHDTLAMTHICWKSKTIENADLKAQIQEKVFANVALKNELRKNQSVVRQPNAFKSEWPNFSKPRFASQVDVNNVLSKPVTQHYLPKGRESAFAKPNYMIASSSSKNNSKNMSRFSSNDMVHNYYLEKAKKKTQEKDRKSTTSVMPFAKSQNTTKSCKSKPRSNNHTFRVLPTSKSSCPTTTVMPKADHSRNSSPFSDFKHFVCLTCQKCVFNGNHDACITKFLKEVNSRAKIQPNKTRNSNKPVDPTSHTQKPGRKIVTGHSFSPNKSSAVHEKTNTPRSYLRWIPTGRIFNTAGLKWVPTGKTFTSSTTKVDCELPNGSNDYITNPYKCDQTLNVSAGTLNLSADQHPCFMIMVSVDNTSGPAPQRKEECTLQCALSSKEEKSSCILKSFLRKILVILAKHQSEFIHTEYDNPGLSQHQDRAHVEHAEYDESNTYVLERINTTAGNPVKKILLKLNLSDHRSILTDLKCRCIKVKEFQRSFRYSDTERLSRSDEVLKLKNFKKDATLKLFKSTNQVRYEHVGPTITSYTRWQDSLR